MVSKSKENPPTHTPLSLSLSLSISFSYLRVDAMGEDDLKDFRSELQA